jgi:ferredoxin
VIAIACRQIRGTLKTIEDGQYWNAYNCDSYQFLNEILSPMILRKICLVLEQHGYTSVPIHNPFHPHSGRPVKEGQAPPDGMVSLRVMGCAAGLGELGLSKVFLTPQFGPRQRVFAVLTDAELEADPLMQEHVCDGCGLCAKSCPAEAISTERKVEVDMGDRVFRHGELDCQKCVQIHQGWDPEYSPFLKEGDSRENPPSFYKFIDHRYRHHSICGGRGCLRACMDHLEKTGKIEKQYKTPMIEGKQWTLNAECGTPNTGTENC